MTQQIMSKNTHSGDLALLIDYCSIGSSNYIFLFFLILGKLFFVLYSKFLNCNFEVELKVGEFDEFENRVEILTGKVMMRIKNMH